MTNKNGVKQSNSSFFDKLDKLPATSEEEKSRTIKIAKKFITKILTMHKDIKTKVIDKKSQAEFLSFYNSLKKTSTTGKKIKSLKFGIRIALQDDESTYDFVSSDGYLTPELTFKKFDDYNLIDAMLLQIGGKEIVLPDIKNQLLSALIIICSIVIKKFLGTGVSQNANIKEAIEEIDSKTDQFTEAYIKFFHDLIITTDYYKKYESIEQLLIEVHESDLPLNTPIFDFKPLIHDFDELHTKDFPQTIEAYIEGLNLFSKNLLISSLTSLDDAVNQAIDLGLLDEYKFVNRRKNNSDPICTEHSLLNNRKLLRRLDSSELNKLGNSEKNNINSRLKNKIKNFLISNIKHYITTEQSISIPKVANTLSQRFSLDFEKIIKDDQDLYKHKTSIKSENLTPIIEKIIRENEELNREIPQATKK